tara:strand:- start:48 stop:224 length:177 start_codon:yes stop_codon:yes gene_type:complete
MTLSQLRALAAEKNLKIETSRDVRGWSYWLVDKNGKDLFVDDNFYTSKKALFLSLKNI